MGSGRKAGRACRSVETKSMTLGLILSLWWEANGLDTREKASDLHFSKFTLHSEWKIDSRGVREETEKRVIRLLWLSVGNGGGLE